VERTGNGRYTVKFSTGAGATNYVGLIQVSQTMANQFYAGLNGTGSQLATSFGAVTLNAATPTDGLAVM
jgi:hypothetical protein